MKKLPFPKIGFEALLLIFSIKIIFLFGCKKDAPPPKDDVPKIEVDSTQIAIVPPPLFELVVEKNISIDEYFDYINEVVHHYDSLVPYQLTEYLLVHANERLIDTFAQTDYYFQMEKGNFFYDQKKQIVFHKNDTLVIPNESDALEIQEKINSFSIDINIPEFKLRVLQKDSILHTFPVRVGKKGKRFMSTVGRDVKMPTRTGVGKIAKINRDPRWENPVNGKEYITTQRDDKRRTLVPRIPFLHPEIDGHRWGQLIHPTTNPETLGKASSNGCIGTREGDAWIIYFHAPIETRVVIRYDLEIERDGEKITLKDIYGKRK